MAAFPVSFLEYFKTFHQCDAVSASTDLVVQIAQNRIVFNRWARVLVGEIVDCNELQIRSFNDAQHIAPDASEPVNASFTAMSPPMG